MESKYNLLTRLLKNIKNVITPDGSVAGGALIVHEVERRGETFLEGTLPNVDGYAWRSTGDNNNGAYYVDVAVDLDGEELTEVDVKIGNERYLAAGQSYNNGVLTIRVGTSNTIETHGYTSESQIAGLNIAVYTSTTTLDKTYKEIADAGFAVLHIVDNGANVCYLTFFGLSMEGAYLVEFEVSNYIAETENDYPVLAPEVPGGKGPRV